MLPRNRKNTFFFKRFFWSGSQQQQLKKRTPNLRSTVQQHMHLLSFLFLGLCLKFLVFRGQGALEEVTGCNSLGGTSECTLAALALTYSEYYIHPETKPLRLRFLPCFFLFLFHKGVGNLQSEGILFSIINHHLTIHTCTFLVQYSNGPTLLQTLHLSETILGSRKVVREQQLIVK